MSKLNLGMKACGVLLLWATAGAGVPAQALQASSTTPIFAPIFSFDFTDGAYPYAGLVQGADGNLYGATFGGGCGQGDEGEGCGTVFKITPGGKQQVLYIFCSQGGDECTDGLSPRGGLVQGTDGYFYGMTSNGGAGYGHDDGTIFKMTPGGALTTLYGFCSQGEECPDGASPFGGLVEGSGGNFYGTTGAGGTNDDGTVFKVTPSGILTTLYSFCAQGGIQCPDGIGPLAGLVLGTDGKFYGTTYQGGADNGGTVFSITAGGTLTTLHNFCSQPNCADGEGPKAPLIEGTDRNFYGTTYLGESVFRMTPDGNLTTLYQFLCVEGHNPPCPDGRDPVAPLVQGTDGNFYGTTEYGGTNGVDGDNCNIGCGTIFQITPGGQLTTLYAFCSQSGCPGGSEPVAGLVQETNGTLYGTSFGGPDYGVVYSLSVGLGPFVATNPKAARVGKKVGILDTNLTGATSVTFNGTAAQFKVRSQTLIVAEVPDGAITGTVQVQLPSGTLSSNVPFIVLP
jgi:uncharacterized repeat protein (TIGR03803 family)